ncbi:serine hydrolase domain-containing protein [Kribbella deserti]|uniref:Serine hydrolase domain-containing protein n=1 Tax=Kribbella deserti TaxID=1926257 RepID=A0ABV6QGL6_9ACTN
MRNKMLAGVAAATLLVGVAAAPAATAVAPERATTNRSDLQKQLDGLVRDWKFPAALASVDNGKTQRSYVAGRSQLGGNQPPPREGRVRAGSNTKTFVAVVVLQLVAEGKVKLDAPIEDYLPGLVRGKGIDGRNITVRQLLQHTSGLPNYTAHMGLENFEKLRNRYYQPRELLDIALAQPASSKPGAKWEYSNTNYVLAGLLIERVSGRPVAEQVADRILKPLNLRGTYWPAVGDMTIQGRHPHGYHVADAPSKKIIDVTELDPSWGWAAGQLISTTGDLNRFFSALLGGKLLPAAELAQMKKTVPAEMWSGARYGLGLVSTPLSCGGVYWGHGGDIHGYETRGGVTTSGRAAAIAVTSLPGAFEPDNGEKAAGAVLATVDKALCS